MATCVVNVANQAKSQPIEIESKALFLIADIDTNRVDAEVRSLTLLKTVLIVAGMQGRPLVANDYKVLGGE